MLVADPALSPGGLITCDDQLQFGDLLLGTGTRYRWRQLTGWDDLPDLDSGDVPRPATHGSWPGQLLARERVVTVDGFVLAKDAIGSALIDLRRALSVAPGIDEVPLVVRIAGETLLVWARVTSLLLPRDNLTHAGYVKLTTQFTASDPRRYSVGEYEMALSIAQPTVDGLKYPLAYPLDYGIGSVVISTGAATNAGTAPTPPKLMIYGPVDGPLIVNQTTGSQLEYDLPLTVTDTLTIDTRAGTVLLNGVADRAYTATPASWPLATFSLVPGDNVVAVRASSAGQGNSLTVSWRDGWW